MRHPSHSTPLKVAMFTLAACALAAPSGFCDAQDKADRSAKDSGSQLLPVCQALGDTATPSDWKMVAKMTAAIQENAESLADALPYAQRSKMAPPSAFTALLDPTPGDHSLWRDARHISKQPPPHDAYIHTAAAILNGNLTRPVPATTPKGTRFDPNVWWSGYINKSVVIVNGSIDMDGYIYDSIVIALGPIKVRGYIHNSLVISCYEGKEIAVDVSGGYVSQSLVIGRRCTPGSARQCMIFGDVQTDDLRGATLRDWSKAASLVRSLGGAKLPLPRVERPQPPATPTSESLLRLLLETEQLTLCQDVAHVLAEYRLKEQQVKQIVHAAEEASSDARRNALWHAIRLSRDHVGRKYLIKALVQQATTEQQITFLNTFANPAPFDVPLLVAIYKSASTAEQNSIDDGLAHPQTQLMELSARPWESLASDWDPPIAVGHFELLDGNKIEERRQGDAEHAQHMLLRWLIKNGTREQDRLKAYQIAQTTTSNWPKYVVGQNTRLEMANDLMASSNLPKFRSLAVPLVARTIDPATFLVTEEDAIVRLAALAAIGKIAEEAWTGYSNSRYDLVRRYSTALQDIVEDDNDVDEVRSAAKRLLAKFERWSREK